MQNKLQLMKKIKLHQTYVLQSISFITEKKSGLFPQTITNKEL